MPKTSYSKAYEFLVSARGQIERKKMEDKIIDQAVCLYCDKKFEIIEYGYKRLCPHCGKKLDIFPDSNSYVETPWGTFGIHWESRRLELLKTFLKGLF